MNIEKLQTRKNELHLKLAGIPTEQALIQGEIDSLTAGKATQLAKDFLEGKEANGCISAMREKQIKLTDKLTELRLINEGLHEAVNKIDSELDDHYKKQKQKFNIHVAENLPELMRECETGLTDLLGRWCALLMLKQGTTRSLVDSFFVAESFARAHRYEIDVAMTKTLNRLEEASDGKH